MRRSKTNAVRVGKFGSKAELKRFKELELLQQAGKIAGLKAHPRYRLEINDILIGHYTPDSEYVECDTGFVVVEEVKGWRTEAYQLRKKIFCALYKDHVHREITQDDRRDLFR
jgi:hypothetical protein